MRMLRYLLIVAAVVCSPAFSPAAAIAGDFPRSANPP